MAKPGQLRLDPGGEILPGCEFVETGPNRRKIGFNFVAQFLQKRLLARAVEPPTLVDRLIEHPVQRGRGARDELLGRAQPAGLTEGSDRGVEIGIGVSAVDHSNRASYVRTLRGLGAPATPRDQFLLCGPARDQFSLGVRERERDPKHQSEREPDPARDPVRGRRGQRHQQHHERARFDGCHPPNARRALWLLAPLGRVRRRTG